MQGAAPAVGQRDVLLILRGKSWGTGSGLPTAAVDLCLEPQGKATSERDMMLDESFSPPALDEDLTRKAGFAVGD